MPVVGVAVGAGVIGAGVWRLPDIWAILSPLGAGGEDEDTVGISVQMYSCAEVDVVVVRISHSTASAGRHVSCTESNNVPSTQS